MHGRFPHGLKQNTSADAARITTTPRQLVILVTLFAGMTASLVIWPSATLPMAFRAFQIGFLILIGWRILALLISQRPQSSPPAEPALLPKYSIVVALYDEAAILPQLVQRLRAIDYPADLLDGYLVLEAHDHATINAANALRRPHWLNILVVPPGVPTTKPRALNHALAVARGELLTVYDAEDDPDPLQLREAAAHFAAEDNDLVCMQAPLRIRRQHKGRDASPFMDRQFAAEYAALFEVTLPAMSRLGLPFPLGGTSNHFRVSALRALGGWDAWNVTEDADLGFRIWRRGWRLGVLTRPTYETPPGRLLHWLPQRTRWVKGYMQTLLVHTRSLAGMGFRGWLALGVTLGAAVAASALHAVSVALIGVFFLMGFLSHQMPSPPWFGLAIMVIGAATALLTSAIGAHRAHTPFGLWEMLAAPFYWSLLSLAFVHALVRLIVEPHRWDKTAHRPDVDHVETVRMQAPLVADAGRAAA